MILGMLILYIILAVSCGIGIFGCCMMIIIELENREYGNVLFATIMLIFIMLGIIFRRQLTKHYGTVQYIIVMALSGLVILLLSGSLMTEDNLIELWEISLFVPFTMICMMVIHILVRDMKLEDVSK